MVSLKLNIHVIYKHRWRDVLGEMNMIVKTAKAADKYVEVNVDYTEYPCLWGLLI